MDNEQRSVNEDPNNEEELDKQQGAPVPQVSEEEAESALSRAFRQYQDDPGSDTFIETIYKRKMQGSDYAKIAGIMVLYFVLLTVVFILVGIIPIITTLVPLFIIGGAFGAWWLITGLNKEYEYVVTKGDLDIDMIIARRRRKRAYSVKAKDIEMMASCSSDEYKSMQKQANLKVINLAAVSDDPQNWFIVSQYNSARTMAIISADERVIRNIHRHARHRVRYNPAVGV